MTSAAGQNTIAELLSPGKRLILLPEPRPYNEQAVHANVLANHHVALLAEDTFSPEQWQSILQKAKIFTSLHPNLVIPSSAEGITQQMRNWYG